MKNAEKADQFHQKKGHGLGIARINIGTEEIVRIVSAAGILQGTYCRKQFNEVIERFDILHLS